VYSVVYFLTRISSCALVIVTGSCGLSQWLINEHDDDDDDDDDPSRGQVSSPGFQAREHDMLLPFLHLWLCVGPWAVRMNTIHFQAGVIQGNLTWL